MNGSSTCDFCDVGTFQDASYQSGCIYCAIGDYSNTQGVSSCKAVPVGYYQSGYDSPSYPRTSRKGHSLQSKLIPVLPLFPGANTTTACPEGTYNDELRSTTCKDVSFLCALHYTTLC